MAAGDDVGRDGAVGVADVGARVDVVDRRGEIELLFGHAVAKGQFSRVRGVGLAGAVADAGMVEC